MAMSVTGSIQSALLLGRGVDGRTREAVVGRVGADGTGTKRQRPTNDGRGGERAGGTGKKKRRKTGSKSRGATRAVRWERQRATEHDEATKGSGNRGDRPS